MQFKRAPILTLEECHDEFAPLKVTDQQEWEQSVEGLSDKIVCTKNRKGSGTCDGDSGSALDFNDTLVGILSWSVRCEEGFPSVFTRIFPQMDWINKQLSEI